MASRMRAGTGPTAFWPRNRKGAVMRRGHGLYGLTDPFVQEIWRERRALSRAADGDGAPAR